MCDRIIIFVYIYIVIFFLRLMYLAKHRSQIMASFIFLVVIGIDRGNWPDIFNRYSLEIEKVFKTIIAMASANL